jgi:hypothetical protein
MAQRISIGIESSPPVGLRVSDEELKSLEKALGGTGWHDIEGEDGTMKLDLSRVTWLKVDKDESRVGFGLGA